MRRKSLTDQRNDTLAGGMPPLANSDVSIFQSNPWPVERQTVLTQIRLSLQFAKIFLKCSSRRQNRQVLCDKRVFGLRDFVYFKNVMLFFKKCADPDEMRQFIPAVTVCQSASFRRESTKGKQNYLVACCRLVVSHVIHPTRVNVILCMLSNAFLVLNISQILRTFPLWVLPDVLLSLIWV